MIKYRIRSTETRSLILNFVAKFFYIAKSLKGESKSGVLEAKDQHELASVLRSQGFMMISANEEGGKAKYQGLSFSIPFFGVSLVEKLMFTRNLQVMISAGISLPRALRVLASQSKSNKLKTAIFQMEKEIVEGKSFSEAVSGRSNIFSEIFSNMIKIGEESGTLENVLGVLALQMEKEHEIKSRILGALMYPAVILVAMIGIGILMMILVIPKLAQTFDDLKIDLPITTRFVIAVGNFFAQFWYLLPFIFIALAIGATTALKTKTGKFIADTIFLKMPIIGPLIKKTNCAQFVRNLSSLIASGVPIVRSLEITAGSIGNVHYKKALREASKKVEKGAKLAEALNPYGNIFSPLILQMIEIGEETGETSSMLAKLADFFEEEVNNTTKNLSSIIEPILMLIIGAAVGFFAISMIQPIYGMLGSM